MTYEYPDRIHGTGSLTSTDVPMSDVRRLIVDTFDIPQFNLRRKKLRQIIKGHSNLKITPLGLDEINKGPIGVAFGGKPTVGQIIDNLTEPALKALALGLGSE